MNRSPPRGTDFILIHVYLSLLDDILFQKTHKKIYLNSSSSSVTAGNLLENIPIYRTEHGTLAKASAY